MGWLNTAVAAEGFFLLLHAIDFLSVGPLRLNPLAPSTPTTHTHSMLNPRPDLMETSDFGYTNRENTPQTLFSSPSLSSCKPVIQNDTKLYSKSIYTFQ